MKHYINIKSRRSVLKLRTDDISKMYYINKKVTPRLPKYHESDPETEPNSPIYKSKQISKVWKENQIYWVNIW